MGHAITGKIEEKKIKTAVPTQFRADNFKMFKLFATWWAIVSWALRFSALADMRYEMELSTADLIKYHGYPLKVYSDMPTEDGYLLDIYRISHGITNQNTKERTPVLLMHGTFRTCRDFVIMGPQKGLAYLLADMGYDVWMPNARGSTYCRKHQTLNPETNTSFWAFSWHEIGYYDLPVAFNLIRNETKYDRFSYIGISQGTAVFYVLTSTRPEYNDYVNIMISLAPISYMGNVGSAIVKMLASMEPIFTILTNALGLLEFPPKGFIPLARAVNRAFCNSGSVFMPVCLGIMRLCCAIDTVHVDEDIILAAYDSLTSGPVRQYLHFAQNINTGLFRQYDYGAKINMDKYGTFQPPSYDLSRITTPVALLYSSGDLLAVPADVERLCRELPKCADSYKIPYPDFNHIDFLIAKNVVKVVFEKVFNLLDTYN